MAMVLELHSVCGYRSVPVPTSFSVASGSSGGSIGGRKMGFGDKGRLASEELSEAEETVIWPVSTLGR